MSKTLSIHGVGVVCFVLLMAAAMPAHAQFWTPRVSDETQPQTCFNNLVSNMWCAGSYCDDMYLFCQPIPGLAFNARSWLPYVSEENGAAICPEHAYVTGIACRDSYCDDISIECTTTSGHTDNCQWSPAFSEEQHQPQRPSPNHYVHGIKCLGDNCDNVRVLWSTLDGNGRGCDLGPPPPPPCGKPGQPICP